MPLDLSALVDFIDGEMVDVVLITRDSEGSTDDVFDEATGVYTPVDPDKEIVYHGPGLILELNVFPSQQTQGGATTLTQDYQLHIPLNSSKIAVDDLVTVEQCDRTPHLVSEEFTVRSTESSSVSVSQVARMYNRKERILQ